MASPKDLLVVTTSSIEGIKIERYLKPVSAHIVAGTNLFSDFFAGITDVFGGRSQTYQKQLVSLYDEAIERVKVAAYEIGANCIIGLSVDMDEISGKGKSMFMLTAIGTAVIVENHAESKKSLVDMNTKVENVGLDRIRLLRKKKKIIEEANNGQLVLDESVWDFITANRVHEVFPYLLTKFNEEVGKDLQFQSTEFGYSNKFALQLRDYLEQLSDDQKVTLLYTAIRSEKNERVALKLSEIIRDYNLYDFAKTMELLEDIDFSIKKRGVAVAVYDKPFFNKQDVEELKVLIEFLQRNFPEKGKRTLKKQILSSKEKEVWTCECGKTNDMGDYCSGCGNNIHGFKKDESKPDLVAEYLTQKIFLISEYL